MSYAGEFAEACRDQFMKEREEYFTELEQKVPWTAIADVANC